MSLETDRRPPASYDWLHPSLYIPADSRPSHEAADATEIARKVICDYVVCESDCWGGYLLAPHVNGLDAELPHRPTDVLHAAEHRVEACIALHTHHGTRATRAPGPGQSGGLARYDGTRTLAQQSPRI